MNERNVLRKWVLVTVGVLAVGLGMMGIFVPVLPTTPFLLLAAACFMRSSKRLYVWLTQHPWFGTYIRNYREHRAMTLRARWVTLAILWGGIGVTILFSVKIWWARVLLGLVAVGVTLHLLLLKTLDSKDLPSSQQICKGGET